MNVCDFYLCRVVVILIFRVFVMLVIEKRWMLEGVRRVIWKVNIKVFCCAGKFRWVWCFGNVFVFYFFSL